MRKGHFVIMLTIVSGVMAIFPFSNFAVAAYPEKPVTLICVWGPGGVNDFITRAIAESMNKYFPQPVVVVNRAGGAGTIGNSEVMSARPDGYTIGSTTTSSLTIKPHQVKLPYNTPDDYTPVALVGTQAFNLSVLTDSPFKTLKDLVEYSKANPGKVRIGTGGSGHISDLIFEQLKFQAQIDISSVPAKSAAESLTMVLGKHIEGTVLTVPFEVQPHVQAGKVRVLALCDDKRSPILPEIRTFTELGYDITTTSYTLLIGPKGLPSEVLSKFQEAYKKVSSDPEFLKRVEPQGLNVIYEGTEELRKRLWRDYRTNKGIFERLGEKKK